MSSTQVPESDEADLEAAVAVLREENRRLREEHRRLLQSNYRRTALGFGGLAVLATLGAAVFGGVRDILIAIAATAAFSGFLTYYLTPERFVAASVGEGVYEATAQAGEALIAELGLSDTQVYLPAENGVQLFVPQHEAYEPPAIGDRSSLFVVSDDERGRGVSLWPTGRRLYESFETTATGPLDETTIGDQLAEALVEQFELVDTATVDSREPGRLTVAVTGSAYGPVDRFDHPVASLIATGVAATIDAPVELETTEDGDDRTDVLITCRWATGEDTA